MFAKMRHQCGLFLALTALPLAPGCGEDCPDGTTKLDGECVADEETEDTAPDTVPVICPAYSGIVGLGTRWEYSYDSPSMVGTYTPEVIAYDVDLGTVIVEGEDAGVGSTFTFSVARRFEYLCDAEGLWMTAESIDGVYVYDDGDDPYSLDFVWDVPALILPADLVVGSTWATEYQGTITYESGSSAPYADSIEYEATERNNVEVPAGSFTGMRIEAYHDGSPYFTSWYDQDVGLLRENYMELVSHTP